MKLTRRNLFRRSAEVAGVAAGAVVAAAIPAKLLESFEPAVAPAVPEVTLPLTISGSFGRGCTLPWSKVRYTTVQYSFTDVIPRRDWNEIYQ